MIFQQQRKLQPLGYVSSYSQRGKFYTLREVAAFDARGLFQVNEARFSRFGSLLETAGDPMTGLKWTRKTTPTISEASGKIGLGVSHTTAARLLATRDYRLWVNHKKIAGKGHPQRNTQFEDIAAQRAIPLISVDTKKKEVVGPFRNAGVVWSRHRRAVRDYDFRSESVGMAIP